MLFALLQKEIKLFGTYKMHSQKVNIVEKFKRGVLGFVFLFAFSYLSAQSCNPNIPLATPNNRFTIINDGTVVDKKTGLMWMRCSLGQSWDGNGCSGLSTNFSWIEAINAGENSSFANHSDWRVPNIKELASILEDACYEPAINETIFPSTTEKYFWSSSPHAVDSADQQYLDFVVGDIYPPSSFNFLAVRLVKNAP